MYGRILALLTLLFFIRIAGQALVAFFDVAWLPAMAQWYSGLIPYPMLLVIQVAMLLVMIKICADICGASGFFAAHRPSWSRYLLAFSALYVATMALRYVLTMVYRPEMRWYGGTIPIVFHLVLAAFIFVLGRYQANASDEILR